MTSWIVRSRAAPPDRPAVLLVGGENGRSSLSCCTSPPAHCLFARLLTFCHNQRPAWMGTERIGWPAVYLFPSVSISGCKAPAAAAYRPWTWGEREREREREREFKSRGCYHLAVGLPRVWRNGVMSCVLIFSEVVGKYRENVRLLRRLILPLCCN